MQSDLEQWKISIQLKIIKLLGYTAKNGTIMVDSERLKQLMELIVPGMIQQCDEPLVFQNWKMDTANSVIFAVDPSILLIAETDACDCAIAASLRQSGLLVAFFQECFYGSNDDTRW